MCGTIIDIITVSSHENGRNKEYSYVPVSDSTSEGGSKISSTIDWSLNGN